MPPFLNGIVSAVSGLVGMGTSQSQTNDANDPTSRNDEEADEVEVVETTGSKRTRPASEETGQERGGKRVQVSKDTRRLVNGYDYKLPKDAQRISVPGTNGYDAEADWNPPPERPRGKAQVQVPVQRMASHKYSGRVKPTNTLGNAAPQSAKGGNQGLFSGTSNTQQQGHVTRRPQGPPRPLETEASRGGNVRTQKTLDDGEFQYTQRPPKKQKMNGGNGGLSSDPVDLTDDNDNTQFGVPVGRERDNGIPPPPRSQASATELSQRSNKSKRWSGGQDPFGGSEQRSVDGMMQSGGSLKGPKKRRRRSHNDTSSNGSSNGVVNRPGPASGDTRPQPGSKFSPVDLSDDEQTQSHSRPATTSNRTREQTANGRPDIDLGRGLDEVKTNTQQRKSRITQGSKDDIKRINDTFATNGKVASARQTQSSTKNRQPPQSNITDSIRASQDAKLRDQFQRDHGNQQKPPRPTMKQKMQDVSAPQRPSTGSEDELSGQKTVGSASSRNTSPNKQMISPTQHLMDTFETTSSTRTLAPSQFKPTTWKQPSRQQTPAVKRPAQVNLDDELEVDDGRQRIHVTKIFSKGFTSDSKGTSLFWDDGEKEFLMEHNGETVRVPHKNKAVTIGKDAVTHGSVRTRDALRLVLKGSKNDVSTGDVLLEFASLNGYLSFTRRMLKSSPVKKLEPEQFMKVFEHLGGVQRQAYEKLKNSAESPRSNNELDLLQHRKAQRDQRSLDNEDRIKYDYGDEPEPPRQKMRSQLQGQQEKTLPEILKENEEKQRRGQRVVSEYFEGDKPTRRSTRQPKPVQPIIEKSPSPERWSRIHNPPPWPRPVVYPKTGARRAEVDFGDVYRLDDGEWLNDNLVSFEMRWIEEHMAPEHRAKVHFFNTFFYTAVSAKNGKAVFNYDAVKRWTKGVDIFNTPYVVVPINLDLHWFVLIICNLPNVGRKFTGFDKLDSDASKDQQREQNDPQGTDARDNGPEDQNGAEQREFPSSANGAGSPNGSVFAFGEDDKVTDVQSSQVQDEQATQSSRPGTATGKKSKKKGGMLKKYNPEDAVIISLDSFASPRPREIRNIKEYVIAEAQEKRSMTLELSDIPGMTAKGIPEQSNFWDCGVYVCGYLEAFAKDPDAFVKSVLTREVDKNENLANFNASKKRTEIREKLFRLQEEQEAEHQAAKRAKAAKKSGQTQMAGKDTAAPKAVAPATQPAAAKPTATPAPTQSNVDISIEEVAPPSSPPKKRQGTPGEPTVNDDGDDLEVEPPRVPGSSSQDDEDASPANGNQKTSAQAEDDEEMLLDDNEGEAGAVQRHEDAVEPSSVYENDLPFNNSRQEDSTSPLSALKNGLDEREKQLKESRRDPTAVIDVDGDENQEPVEEVPDSQENITVSQKRQSQDSGF